MREPACTNAGHPLLNGYVAIADTGLRSCVIIVITVGMIHFYFGYGYWP